MKVEKIRSMPLGARDLMARIPETEVDASPDVMALQSRLDAADQLHGAHVADLQKLLAAQEDARRRQRETQARIDEIGKARGALARQILMGEAQDAEDARQQSEVADLRRQVEVFKLAEVALEPDIREVQRLVNLAGGEVSDCHMELGDCRKVARAELAMARWQA